jgi:hypothetical protein
MAEPLQKPTIDPGQTRRAREADFSYLNESAANDPNASIDERFAENAYQDNVLKPRGLGSEIKPKDVAYEDSPDYVTRRARKWREATRQSLVGSKLPTSLTTAKAVASHARASAINASAFSWQFPLWLFVQVPFAVLSIITLAVVGAMDSLELAANEGGVLEWVINKAVEAAGALASFIGFDFMEMAMSLYFLSTFIILGIGILSILFLYLQYSIGLLRPLSGEAAGLKIGLLLLAIVGLSTPIANLFPFILLWMAAVWYYPR